MASYLNNHNAFKPILLCDSNDWLHIDPHRKKFVIRSAVINLLAAYIAYRVTMSFVEEEESNLKRALEAISGESVKPDLDFWVMPTDIDMRTWLIYISDARWRFSPLTVGRLNHVHSIINLCSNHRISWLWFTPRCLKQFICHTRADGTTSNRNISASADLSPIMGL